MADGVIDCEMVERTAFRTELLERFWRFVCERQRAWYRRAVLREDPPWTDDRILQRHRFTNVYRLLDPGTQYAIGQILERDEPKPDRLFNVMLYRLVGRPETHSALGFQRLDDFDVAAFEAGMRARRGAHGASVFTGAYVVSGYVGMGGADKIANVARLFGEISEGFDEFYQAVEAATGPETVYTAIRSQPGFGNFLAYQVLVDLLYPLSVNDGRSLLPFSPNQWAAAGPGAKRGLTVLVEESIERSELESMKWLWRNQEDEFDRTGVDFDWLRDRGGGRVELSLADVQNCLCEFYKYRKVSTGEGRTRRRFRSEDRRTAGELAQVYEGYPISSKVEDYVNEPE